MWNKPFKPPLLKPREQKDDGESDRYPPSKRLKSSNEKPVNSSQPSSLSANTLQLAKSTARPLLSVSRQVQAAPVQELSIPPSSTDSTKQYFRVLWRKYTTKKNKTWDGDGIVSVVGGYATLQDDTGREMGRTAISKELEEGSALSIAGKEVEIDSRMSAKEYLSGHEHLNVKAKPVSREQTPKRLLRLKTVVRSPGRVIPVPNTHFKTPMMENTVQRAISPERVTPRHDPSAPGALVMPRPRSAPRGKSLVDVVVDPHLTKHLREHQRQGVSFLYECVMGMKDYGGEGAILADEMGLGKTLQTIALLWTLLKQNPVWNEKPVIKRALIVCPVTLIKNWKKEFRKWLGLERLGVLAIDDNKTRITDFTKGRSYHVLIIGYERLRTVAEELSQGDYVDIIVCDEGHRLKTAQNKSMQALQNLSAMKRIILSGTPIQNDLSEFYIMVDFVNPKMLGTPNSFKKQFEQPILKGQQPEALKKDVELGTARSEELAALTKLFILRRTADVLAKYLPPKTECILFCRPTSIQAQVYQSILSTPAFSSALGSTEMSLQLITILKKVCNSPKLLEKTDKGLDNFLTSEIKSALRCSLLQSSGKLRVLDQMLQAMKGTGEKLVIVSNYTSTLDLLQGVLSGHGLTFSRLDGSTPTAKRQDLVDTFNRAPASKVFAFLLSAKSGGAGINLIGASRLILYDVDWNPATDLQAMARIHRDGQKRHVRIYRLLTAGALDEKIWQRQTTKMGLADSVVDYKSAMSSFTQSDLKALFKLDTSVEYGCQTHTLIGCDCDGDGKICSNAPSEELTPAPEEALPDEDEAEASSSDLEVDLPRFPELIRASELPRKIPPPIQRPKRPGSPDKLQALFLYGHFDTKKILLEDKRLDAGAYKLDEEDGDGIDGEAGAKADVIDLVEGDDVVSDDVLMSVLKKKELGPRCVPYIFAKTTR